ncbi:MAG: HlyD family type I secretion periplasmic adaptor subunit [Alphaproteobacteria bacterium]
MESTDDIMFDGLRKIIAIWREASKAEKARPKIKRKGNELEFLPAALEVLETPASPAGRAVLWLILILVVSAVSWASLGRIDTVVVAEGQIIPGGRVKQIQPLEPAIILAIHVKEGQRVKAGDLLVELDPTEAEVNLAQLQYEYNMAMASEARLAAYSDWLLNEGIGGYRAAANVPAALAKDQIQRLKSQKALHKARLFRFSGEEIAAKANILALQAEIEKSQAVLPLLQEREASLQQLLDKGIGRKPEWLEIKQQLIDLEYGLRVQVERLKEAKIALSAIARQRAELIETEREKTLGELVEMHEQRDQAELALRQAMKQEAQNRLVSPVDGVISQLGIHTIGGVAQSAQTLMLIVPEDAPLEVEAMVLNKDIGFIQKDQSVEIKIESFPFTRYGLIEGKVTHLSADAIEDERRGLIYHMRASMHQTSMQVADRIVQLTPGMKLTAEVKTGSRRIISFFFDPMLRGAKEALRER